MNFEHSEIGTYYVIEAAGRLDVTTASVFEKEITDCFDNGHTHVIIDMGGVEYVSSAGLRGILIAARAAKVISGEIRFCGLKGMVKEVFRMSGFGKMFQIFDSVDEAGS